MNKVMLNFFLCCFFFSLISPGLWAQPTEKSLVEAWELIQMTDSKTLVFEKLAENHYKFQTERFPFAGELKILNVSIDETMSDYEDSVIWGVLEVELVDLPEDFSKRHSYSYSLWRRNNTLYFDKKNQAWLSSKEYYSQRQKKHKYETGEFIGILSSYFYDIVFIVVTIIIILFVVRIRKKAALNVQKSFALNEDTNRLLKEILEELRKR